MVTTNQKSATDTHIQKKKQSKHNIKDSHQITGKQKRKGRKKTYKNKSKTIKMAVRTHIHNDLKCKWIKCSNQKTDWLNG